MYVGDPVVANHDRSTVVPELGVAVKTPVVASVVIGTATLVLEPYGLIATTRYEYSVLLCNF